jgi:hypothetical protein
VHGPNPAQGFTTGHGGSGGTVVGISLVAGAWKGSSGEGEWRAGNTLGMEARPETHRGSGSPMRRFGGGEAATFR